MNRSTLVTLLALSILTTSSLASAQLWRGRGRLGGRVLDPDGKPIKDAQVSLWFGGDKDSGLTVKTNKKGQWQAMRLRGGAWVIHIEAEGFQTSELQTQLKEMSRARHEVDVTMPRLQVVEKDPEAERSNELRELLAIGDAAFKQGDFATARMEYERVLAEKPDLFELRRSIAFCHYREGNKAEAIAMMQTVADQLQTPDLLLMANLQLETDQLDDAIVTLERIDRTTVSDAQTWVNVGIRLYNQHKTDEALRYFTTATEIQPDYARSYYYRGLARLQQQQNAEAKADFQRYLDLDPEGADAAAAREVLKAL